MTPRLTHEEIADRVTEVMSDIPDGCVMTYGDVADLIGTVARHVGRVLATGHLDVPWWRVVNARGLLPEHLRSEALGRYREEGTPVRDGHADLRCCRWWSDDCLGDVDDVKPAPRALSGTRNPVVSGLSVRDDGMNHMTTLLRAQAVPPVEQLVLDASQARAVEAPDRVRHVVGASGTGKTTVALECVARAVEEGLAPDECVLLSPTRLLAGALRERVTARIAGTSSQPIARTPQALAFGILRARASLEGLPAPRLLAGPEQDVVLKELLAGHQLGLGTLPQWPQDLSEALTTRGFRNELRDLLMRASEWGVTPEQLDALGRENGRPEWCAAATVFSEYDAVTALSRPGAFDPASILGAAADALTRHTELLERYRGRFKLIVIDDAQELTRATVGFLETLVGPAQSLVVIGDPDVTVQGFRGADPKFMREVAQTHGATQRFTLDVGYRAPARLRAVQQRLCTRIGAVDGAVHREVEARPGGEADVALLRSAAQQASHIAGLLRRAHLIEGVAWKDMAVIVRGSGGTTTLRRALNAASVPVAVPPASLALRDEPAVRPFLVALDVVTSPEMSVTPDRALDLLTSPLGAADPIVLRRLRRALRREELALGGARTSDQLLGACLLEPALLASVGSEGGPARRVATVLAAGREAWVAEPTGSAERVLWAMWQAADLARAWEEIALGGGVAGTRADRDLDALVVLFGAAAAYVDRLPGAGARDFLDHVRGQDVPGDRLMAVAPDDDAVALLTPAAAAGREWHTVVVAGVQDGVWPDLRLRGSVLGSEALVDLLSERGQSLAARQAAVRYDETRQFVMAVSRARERLLVTAVRDDDEQPSVYLDIVDPLPEPVDGQEKGRPFAMVTRGMTLPTIVAESRRLLASSDEALREEAAERLARLAAADVPGADLSQWWSLVALSDDRPLRSPAQLVRVSPSKVEGFHQCPLNWLLTTNGAYGPSLGASTIGTLVHELAQEFADTDPELMPAALEARWPRLGMGENWISRAELARSRVMITRLQTYLADAAAGGWSGAGAEVPFTATIGRAKISGMIDRLERHSSKGLRVIDYKTGSSKPTKDEVPVNPQLTAYQAAFEAGAFGVGETSGGAVLVHLGKAAGSTPKPSVQTQAPLFDVRDEPETDPTAPEGSGPQDADAESSNELIAGSSAWARDLMERTAEGMGAGVFRATLNNRCTICAVRSSCPIQPEGRTL